MEVTNDTNSVREKFFLINLIALSAFIDLLIQFEIWSAHWSFESKITPRTFIFLFEVTIFPYKLSEIGVESLFLKHVFSSNQTSLFSNHRIY